MTDSRRIPTGVALAVAAIGWALAPVFIRLLSDAYDPYSQAFVRYASAALALVGVCLVAFRQEFFRLLRNPRGILALAALNVLQQCTWTIGCYGSTATAAQLITKLNVVFVIIFAFFLFREERAVICNPLYAAGTSLGLVGVAAVLARDPSSLVPVLDRSSVLLLLTAMFWGVYIVWARRLVLRIHPVPMFTVLAILTTFGFGILSLLLGRAHTLVEAGPRTTAIAIVSGLLPIATAHPCFHYAQKHLGSAFCTSIILLNPLLTYLFGTLMLPDESLTSSQWVGAAILLSGTLMVTVAGHRVHAAQRANS